MIFQLLLLLLYAAGDFVCGLPITSTPLESNPDHLAWDALLSINTGYSDHEEARKIPKSIFITPNLNDSKVTCKPGYKLGSDGKCYKTNNFAIDPLDILKTQIESLFNGNKEKPTTNVEYEDYDYDAYDATDSNEPFHVPLSLSFADEQPQQADEKKPTELLNLPFRGEETVGNVSPGKIAHHKSEPEQQQLFLGGSGGFDASANGKTETTQTDGTTTNNGPKDDQITEPIGSVGSTTAALHDKRPYQFLALSAITDGKTENGGVAVSPVGNRPTSTESPFELMLNGIIPSSAKKHSEKLQMKPFSQKTEHYGSDSVDDDVVDDGSVVTTTTTTTTLDATTTLTDVNVDNGSTEMIDAITHNEDEKKFQIELQGESLFEDDSSSSTIMGNIQTTVTADGTTEFSDNTEPQPATTTRKILHADHGDAIKSQHTSSTIPSSTDASRRTATTKPKNNEMHLQVQTIVVVPSTTTTNKSEQVQIVTPVHTNDLPTQPPQYHSSASADSMQTIHDHTVSSIAPSASVSLAGYSTLTTTNKGGDLLNIENDSDLNKKLRESIIKHERNEDAIETIDQHNRFVYNRLETSSHRIPTVIMPTTTVMPPTAQPTSTLRNLIEHLRMISNKYSEAQSQKHSSDRTKVRFPDHNQSGQYSMGINGMMNVRAGSNSIDNPKDSQRVVKFPGPVSQRNPVPNRNRLIPEELSRKPPDPQPPEKQTYSWPPRGWQVDRSISTANTRPVLMRFWNKMPLIRDPSFSDVSERTRENSKSPTDSLFEEIPVSDVYKVLPSRNYKHNNR